MQRSCINAASVRKLSGLVLITVGQLYFSLVSRQSICRKIFFFSEACFSPFPQANCYLIKHEKEVHGESREFKCPEPDCNQSFKSKRNLSLHRNTHKTIKPFQCMWCDFTGRLNFKPGGIYSCTCTLSLKTVLYSLFVVPSHNCDHAHADFV